MLRNYDVEVMIRPVRTPIRRAYKDERKPSINERVGYYSSWTAIEYYMFRRLSKILHPLNNNNNSAKVQFSFHKGENNQFFPYLCSDIYHDDQDITDSTTIGDHNDGFKVHDQQQMKICQVNIHSKSSSGVLIILRPLDSDLLKELESLLDSIQNDQAINPIRLKLNRVSIPKEVELETILKYLLKNPPNEFNVTSTTLGNDEFSLFTIIKNVDDDIKDVLKYHNQLRSKPLRSMLNSYDVEHIVDNSRFIEFQEQLPCYREFEYGLKLPKYEVT